MISVVLVALVLAAAVGALFIRSQRRQTQQIRSLMDRLDRVESGAEGGGFRSQISDEGNDGSESAHKDVLAGRTTFIQRVVAEASPINLAEHAVVKIHTHLDEGYRPAQLAEDLYISLRSLERGLAEAFDCSPGQLITAMKMREARRLLTDEGLRVNEVASRLGFSSPFYFSRRFRTHFGFSPSSIRGNDGD